MRNRGSIIPKGDQKYLVRVYLYKDAEGKRVYASKLVDGSWREADKERTRMLRDMDTRVFTKPSKQTVRDFLAEWLAGKTDVGAWTKRGYADALRLHVTPIIGHLTLDQLGNTHVQRVYDAMLAAGKSPRTIELVHRTLSQAFSRAVQWGLISKNPCQYTTRPKKVRQEQSVLSPDQVQLFLERTADGPLHALWCLLLTAGLRPQEALALQWSDITDTSVRINRALVQVSAGKYELQETKTQGSRRTVSVPAETSAALWRHRKSTAAVSGQVFRSNTGGPLDIANVRRCWKAALRASGLPVVRLYDARHTHITHLLMAGVHPKVAADRAGHSTVNLTLNTYSHVLPEVDKAAAETIGVLLFKRKSQEA